MGKARLCHSGACTCGALQGYMGCSSTFQRNTWAHGVFAGCAGEICCEETVLKMFVQSYMLFFGASFYALPPTSLREQRIPGYEPVKISSG